MLTTCVVCNVENPGMIAIYQHPNNLDFMLNLVSGHQVDKDDYLCVYCYDELKIAFNFQQKCQKSKLFRANVRETVAEAVLEEKVNQLQEDVTTSSSCVIGDIQQTFPDDNSHGVLITVSAETPIGGICEEDIEDYFIDDKSLDHNSDTGAQLKIYAEGKCILKKLDSEVDSFEEKDHNDNEQEEVVLVEEEDEEEEEDGSNEKHDCKAEQELITCRLCNKTFKRSASYKRHMYQIHSMGEKKEKIPRDKHRRGPVPNYQEDDVFRNLKENQCEYCYKIFNSVEEHQTHEDSHRKEERPYRCSKPECMSRFKDRYSVRCHLTIHKEEKRFKCRYCDKKFHHSGNVKAHERYHTGEKPYICPHCSKGFAENGNLKAHIRYHTGERPYECPYCEKTFRTHYSHKIHVRSHTNEKPFQCSNCGKQFNCSGKLKIHQRIHTGVRPFKCIHCSAAFMDNSRLKRHLKTHA